MASEPEKAERFLAATSAAVHAFAREDLRSYGDGAHVAAALYSVEGGGKRLRPALVIAAALAFSRESDEDVRSWIDAGGALVTDVPVACAGASTTSGALIAVASAFEYIHTYSLIHDDLPVMDNDAVRRGRPSCHVEFGVPTAVAAGLFLIVAAFSAVRRSGLDADGRISDLLRRASGLEGMVTGQALDILGEKRRSSKDDLVLIHKHKTAALIRGSMLAGALAARAGDAEIESMGRIGDDAGLAFQIVDDLLDVESTAERMGKPVGVDSAKGKSTYPSILGIAESKRMAADLVAGALDGLNRIGKNDSMLAKLVRFVLRRER